jgi:hypothetical protein
MPNDFLHEFWQGLRFQLPYLAAYVFGIALALNYWRRYPTPCLYTFLGCAIKLAMAILYPLTAALLLPQGDFRLFEFVTVATAVTDASAYGLLLLAVFSARATGRPRRYLWPDDWDNDDEARPTAPPPLDDTGLQERKP